MQLVTHKLPDWGDLSVGVPESAFWTRVLWTRASIEAWRVCESLLCESLNKNGMLFEHYFEHSLKWTNLVSQLLNLPSVKIRVLALLAKFYCIWFCSDNLHCWVLPGMGLFHQQFFKTIFGFGSMWQLRISHLDFDVLLATNELVFNMLLRVWMLEEKHWTAQRQLKTLYIHVAASQFLVPNQSFLWNDTPCKGVGLGELSPCSKLSKGPCMDVSLHVPNGYIKVAFHQLLS